MFPWTFYERIKIKKKESNAIVEKNLFLKLMKNLKIKPTKNLQKTDKNRQKPFLFLCSSEKPTKSDTDFALSVPILAFSKVDLLKESFEVQGRSSFQIT